MYLFQVIMNTAISKTTKVHMFSEKGLKELGRLYNWQGLAKWKQTLKQKGKQPDTPYVCLSFYIKPFTCTFIYLYYLYKRFSLVQNWSNSFGCFKGFQ
jgi:hypothetical protein